MDLRRVGEEIDDRHAWCLIVEHRLHLAGIGSGEAEIGEEHDHARKL